VSEVRHAADRPQRPRVVIVGGGFAGINAAHELRGAPVDVVLLDRRNYHTFLPLLYQVGTGYLAVEEVGTSLRQIFRRQANVTVRLATVVGIDRAARTVALDGADEPLAYDTLILAAGAATHYLDIPGMREFAWPLYTLDDAIGLRMHLLSELEAVLADDAPGPKRETVVVVGGGPTGVETAGALASMAQEILEPGVRLHVVLVEASGKLLSGFAHQSADAALRDLERRGVEVRLTSKVAGADAAGVVLDDGERIDSRAVIWAAGVKAASLAAASGLPLGANGRIVVEPTLAVRGDESIFAVGDVAVVADGASPAMMAPAAIQMGRHAARQVRRQLAGEPLEPFSFRDKGKMAVLGRGDAVAELPVGPRELRLRGFGAWVLWLGIHVVYLIGFRNRLKVLVDWGWTYFTSRGAGAILLPFDDARRPPPRPPASRARRAKT
jgi:NADH dehydrogenase